MDIGDIVGIEGEVFKTKTGEISVHASQVTLLSKSLQILPEKISWSDQYRHPLSSALCRSDHERRRKRNLYQTFQIISAVRQYLNGQGFLEVETPMLVSNAGGAAARPFETHYNALDEDVKLRISLELYLKRLIVGGMERVFEIGRVFRNEGTGHQTQSGIHTDGAVPGIHRLLRNDGSDREHVPLCGTDCSWHNVRREMDLGKPFERITMVDAVKKYAGVDFDQIPDTAAAKKLADEKGHIEYEGRHAKGDILNLFLCGNHKPAAEKDDGY